MVIQERNTFISSTAAIWFGLIRRQVGGSSSAALLAAAGFGRLPIFGASGVLIQVNASRTEQVKRSGDR